MQDERGQDDIWGQPQEARARAVEALGGLGYSGPGPAALLGGGRARLIRAAARVAAYAVAAGALFAGGWFAHAGLGGGDSSPSPSPQGLAAALFPEEGVTLNARWGDIPRRLVEEGVIDLNKLKAAAQRAGAPLTEEQLKLLSEGSDEPITVNAQNAYFLLNLLWALGLANNNTVLTQGPMAQRGWERAGGYASTGGWTLGVRPGPHYLASLDLLPLTPEQQAVVDEVAYNSYRPCCGNMTAFPDCNHGMAALALTELMAAQGASADEIFLALKRVSPFWFPKQYQYVATFFQRQGQDWEDVDPRLVMGKDYSSIRGFKQVAAWVQQQGGLASGAGSSRASGCAP